VIALASALVAGRLIVFQQDGAPAAKDFAATALPRIRALAASRGIALDVRDVKAGTPAEVHTSPLIVYQDAEGRSIFRGRYGDLDRITQFLRTVSGGPLANSETTQENVLAWRRGRGWVMAPIKITSLTGVLPPRHDDDAFLLRARRAIESGFTRFRSQRRVSTNPSDRSFYLNFYPFRDTSGRLFVSTEIFSGFDCVEPVFKGSDVPVSGSFEDQDLVFARAAKVLEERVAELVTASKIGDAFDPVGVNVHAASWESLGLALPPAPPEKRTATKAPLTLASRLRLAEASEGEPPRLQFRFLPPLDTYNGEVRDLTGTIVLGAGSGLRGATGTIEAATASVTMGNKTLDSELAGPMLKVATYPKARFTLDPVEAAGLPLTAGAPTPFTATGRFEMLGLTVPVRVLAQAEAGLGEDGTPAVHVRAKFQLRIKEPFGLKGPDGPSPANDTLEFDVRLTLVPEASASAVSSPASR
jgi:polyisoprenoid-binding protein YceI